MDNNVYHFPQAYFYHHYRVFEPLALTVSALYFYFALAL